MFTRPSFVNGFGRTSFIPADISVLRFIHITAYIPCWKYIEMSSLRMFEVMAMIGVLSNWRMR